MVAVGAARKARISDRLEYSAELLGLSWQQVRWRREQARRRALVDSADALTPHGFAVLRETLGARPRPRPVGSLC